MEATGLIHLLVWFIVVGIIFGLLFWLIKFVALPEPFAKVATVILAVVAVLLIINVLLAFVGHPVVKW